MNFKKIARNVTLLLLIVQAFSSFGNSVMATVTTIVGAELSGSEALSGLPASLLQIGAAAASILLGFTMDRLGRRRTLAGAIGIGGVGAVIAALSIMAGSFLWFLGGLALVGFTRAGAQMGRFVAAEVSPQKMRGRSISYVILGGTFGSVIGPYLLAPSGRIAAAANLNEFVGPYGVALITFLISALIILLFLRPEPLLVAKRLAEEQPETLVHSGPTRSLRKIVKTPDAIIAITAMVFGQVVMVSLMGITTLHMRGHDHPFSNISIVFSAHTFGMFAFSILTGQLLDRWGRGPVILAGTVMLFIASAIAPLRLDVLSIAFALFLLGLGWNFSFIGGSTLLSDILTPEERAKTQGTSELLIAGSTALASFGSGLIFAAGGYSMAGIIGAVISVLPFSLTTWWIMQSRRPAAV